MRHHKLIRLAALLFLMILSAPMAKADLIAWYPLHGDPTAKVGCFDGELDNCPTPVPDQNGTCNGALSFQASPCNSPTYSGSNTGSYVSVPFGAGLPSLQQGTIALWVNWSGMQGVGWQNRYGAVTARQSNGKYSNNVIGLNDADPNLATLTWQPFGAGGPVAVGATPVGDGVWHFVAVTFDGNAGQHLLYLDGNVDGCGGTAFGTMNSDTSSPFTIGAWNGDGATYSNSAVHDVYIFDRVLSQCEIQGLQATGCPP